MPCRQSPSEGQLDNYFIEYERCRLRPEAEERWAYFDASAVATDEFRGIVNADPSVVAAVEDWSSCMESAGFDYGKRDEMYIDFEERLLATDDLEATFEEEVNVALRDVECSVGYRETLRDVIFERFDEYQALLDTALAEGAAPEGQGFGRRG